MNALRIALGIFSGKNILYFGVQKRLRAFLNPIFTGRGRDGKRQLPRWFPAETAARREKYPFRHRLRRCHPFPTLSLTRHLSPAGESLSKGTASEVAARFPI